MHVSDADFVRGPQRDPVHWGVESRRPARRVREARRRLDQAKAAEQAAIRRIRLISQDLRSVGLKLQGIADNAEWIGPQFSGDVTVVAATVFDMADDLHEFTLQAEPGHILNDEQLNLTVVLDGALSDVASAIRPGKREWRTAPASPTPIRADRRALRYVLTRVLIVVVRAGQDGVIDIALAPHDEGLALILEASGHEEDPAPPPSADEAKAANA